MNYFNKLNEAINSVDIDGVKYCLDKIDKWYEKNISEINNNEYVFNYDSHMENKNKIKEFKETFEKYDQDVGNQYNEVKNNCNNKNIKTPIIFLSHKSDDKKYGDALEKFITGLGVKNDQLIYTSHPLHKIPLDENIYDYLRKNINSRIFMIILWSDTYLLSPACLNEMGAAWVSQSDYTNIYVPTFSFGNPKYHECAVDTNKMGAVLNGDQHCKLNMIDLKNKIEQLFDLKNDEKETSYLLDKFVEEISK